MKHNSLYSEKQNSRIIFWAITAILFLPVIIMPPYLQPSDWSRAMLFRVILTALISYLLFQFFYKKNLSLQIPRWNKFTYAPVLAFGAYLVITLTSTAFSQDMRFSIFGSPGRAGGVLSLVFFALFAMVTALCIHKNQWQKLCNAVFIAGILASLVAIVQYFNLLKNILLSFEGGSTPSLLGNSTVLATYMLFLSFMAFIFFVQKPTKKEKMIYGALSFLFAFTIFITGSRAAYLAVLAGLLYFFLWYPYPQKYQRLKASAAALIMAAVLIVALFNIFPQIGKTNNIAQTISSRVAIPRIANDIFGTRLSAWKMTFKAIQEKPLLGWGPENFYIGFEKQYDPAPFATPKLLWDRPHNIILDIAIQSGILAILPYLAFWTALFWQLRQAKRLAKQQGGEPGAALFAHGLQAMFIGYLVILFFNFDSFTTYVISFFLIGYSLHLIWLPAEKKLLVAPPSVPFKKPFMAILLAMLLLFVWFWNIKPLYINEQVVHAKNLASQGSCKAALAATNDIPWEKTGIVKPHVILLYSDIVKNCAFVEPKKEVEYAQNMVSLLGLAAKIQPHFSRTWLFMGSFTNVLAARQGDAKKQEELLAQAMTYLQKAIFLSPKRQEIFAEMGKNHLIAKNYAAMEKTGQECIAIDSRSGECYWHLGIGQIFLGNQEEGAKNIALALQNSYVTPPYKQLAVAYMSQNNWKAATAAYEKISIYYDQASIDIAASHHATLAYLYQQSGNFTRAGEEALKVFKLQPDNPEVVQFIKLVLAKSPSDPIINSSLAFIYAQPGPQQEVQKAIAIYSQLVANYPDNPDYRWRLAEIYYTQKDYARAYVQAIAIVRLFPERKDQVESFIKKLNPIHWENYIHRIGF